MTGKEALKDLLGILINFERLSDVSDKQDIKKQKFNVIEKDLDLLEEYRKIEEELGVDFITLFKALNGCWFLQIGAKKALGDIRPTLVYQCGWHLKPKLSELPMLYALKDYGKTWALTREELEK